ncbi:hypothetical protein Tco_0359156 [Tanacetum coccineum]
MINFIFKIDLHGSPLKASLHKHGMKLLLPKLLEHGVRIREIEGECDEMFTTRKSKKPESSEDEFINKVGDDDNYGGNGGAFGEQKGDNVNDEDFYDNRDKDCLTTKVMTNNQEWVAVG